MAYNDELGEILDHMSKNELEKFACGDLDILKKKNFDKVYKIGSIQEVRYLCSKELRSIAGHTVMNIKRDEHDLSYKEIIIDVASALKIAFNENDTVEEIEKKVLDNYIQNYYNNMTEEEKDKLISKLVKDMKIQKRKEFLISGGKELVEKMIKEGITHKLGTVVNFTGGTLGYNFAQTLLLGIIKSQAGYFAAGKAILGWGIGGTVLKFLGTAVPVVTVVSTIYSIHCYCKPNTKKLIPIIITIALYRIEKKAQESKKDKLDIWELFIGMALLGLLLYWIFN